MASYEETMFLRFQESLEYSETEDQLKAAGTRLAEDMGYQWFAYFSAGSSFNFISNYPEKWLEHYQCKKYSDTDPIVKQAIESKQSFSWCAADFDSNNQLRNFFDEAGDFGISAGMVTPIRGLPKSEAAALAFAGPRADALKLSEPHASMLARLFGIYFHVHSAGFLRHQSNFKTCLSPREKESLGAIARGHSLSKAAKMSGMTDRNMNHYTARIKDRLGAQTLAHAVALAITKGEISL